MTNEERIAALQLERTACDAAGKTGRVADIDAELARLDTQEVTNEGSSAPSGQASPVPAASAATDRGTAPVPDSGPEGLTPLIRPGDETRPVERPSKSAKTEVWAAYAASLGLTVDDSSTRAELIALVDGPGATGS